MLFIEFGCFSLMFLRLQEKGTVGNSTVVIIINNNNGTLQLWRNGEKMHPSAFADTLRFTQQKLRNMSPPEFWPNQTCQFMLIVSENPIPKALVFSSPHLEFILLHWLVITGQCPDHPPALLQRYVPFCWGGHSYLLLSDP